MDRRDRMTAEEREVIRGRVLMAMTNHIGAANCIGMGELYEKCFGKAWTHRINDTRKLRQIITEIRRDGGKICSAVSHTGGGYYIPSVGSELSDYCRRIRARALRALRMEANLRKIALPELLGQLQTEFGATGGGPHAE